MGRLHPLGGDPERPVSGAAPRSAPDSSPTLGTSASWQRSLDCRRRPTRTAFASRQAADRSDRVAKLSVLSLRKITVRILLRQILIRRGDPKSGKALVDKAIQTGDRINYQRAVERAQQVLVEEDVSGDGRVVARSNTRRGREAIRTAVRRNGGKGCHVALCAKTVSHRRRPSIARRCCGLMEVAWTDRDHLLAREACAVHSRMVPRLSTGRRTRLSSAAMSSTFTPCLGLKRSPIR